MTEKIATGLYRVLIPFERVTTTVYIGIYSGGVAIIDSATYSSDAENYVIPALEELGVEKDRVKWLLLTHTHSDHAGGLPRLAELLPKAKVGFVSSVDIPNFQLLREGDEILGGLRVIGLPGHTEDSVGYLDIKTKTLLSGDCLQLKGIDIYRDGVQYPELYAQSVEKLKAMEIERIVAAHEYDPLESLARGHEEVMRYLDACLDM